MTGRPEDEVSTKVQLLEAQGLEVEAYIMDATSDESIDLVVGKCQEVRLRLCEWRSVAYAKPVSKFGHLDVLVNKAGISRVVPLAESVRSEYEIPPASTERSRRIVCH